MDSSGSVQGLVVRSYIPCNEHSGSVKGEIFLDKLSNTRSQKVFCCMKLENNTCRILPSVGESDCAAPKNTVHEFVQFGPLHNPTHIV
jgi:hypothetical protein